MPCYQTGSLAGDLEESLKDSRDYTRKLEAMLCAMCNSYSLGNASMIRDYSGTDMKPEIMRWWMRHKKQDEKRLKR